MDWEGKVELQVQVKQTQQGACALLDKLLSQGPEPPKGGQEPGAQRGTGLSLQSGWLPVCQET